MCFSLFERKDVKTPENDEKDYSNQQRECLAFVCWSKYTACKQWHERLCTFKLSRLGVCCVFRPANGCSARCSLVELNFLTLKQLFAYF